MEAQLLEYRRKKDKERKSQQFSIKKIITDGVEKFFTKTTKPGNQSTEAEKKPGQVTQKVPISTPRVSSERHSWTISSGATDTSWKPRFLLVLYIVLWFVLWKFFIAIEFGAVYFIVSVSYICYKNTRTGPRDPTKLSAYSVFNANQERLDGTFTTEQFEKELRFGSGSVK